MTVRKGRIDVHALACRLDTIHHPTNVEECLPALQQPGDQTRQFRVGKPSQVQVCVLVLVSDG